MDQFLNRFHFHMLSSHLRRPPPPYNRIGLVNVSLLHIIQALQESAEIQMKVLDFSGDYRVTVCWQGVAALSASRGLSVIEVFSAVFWSQTS